MRAHALPMRLDPEGYLAWESEQPIKHEYLRGEVFAMIGARQDHVLVTLNLAAALKQRLRGGPCRTYVADMKLRIQAADAYVYPDVMVSCDPLDHASPLFIEHPRLIIEVLSSGIEDFDWGTKACAYRMIPELREYALVAIEQRRIELYRRSAGNDWLLHEYGPTKDLCQFSLLDLSLSFAEIFEDLT